MNRTEPLASQETDAPTPPHAPEGSPTDPRFWDGIAERYAAKPVGLPEAFERKIEITRALIRSGDHVIDIGCGTGTLALRLANAAREVHGLDLSSQMIAIARRKAKAAGAGNVRFHIGPFDDDVPFERGTVDGLCAYSFLHLVEDHRAALAQMFRLVRPGGFFVSSTPCLGESWMPTGAIITVMRWLGKAPPVVALLSKRKLLDDIAAVGFVNIEQPDVGARPRTAFVVARKPE